MPTLDQVFLNFSASKLRQYLTRIEDCLDRLTYEQVWGRGSEAENAIGNLVLHLSGNVRQWILTGVAGHTDVRVRDREFAARGDIEIADLKTRLRGSVEEVVAVIERLTPERLADTIEVQKYDVTVLEAVYHVVEHFGYHTGQIIFATKWLTKSDLGYYSHLTQSQHKETLP
ncbi:MAG TPA: DUF1572 family protein [Bryobacteraceae bacterium]|nr:DUF1572 family protein [Bryobacteraceae bacterium]